MEKPPVMAPLWPSQLRTRRDQLATWVRDHPAYGEAWLVIAMIASLGFYYVVPSPLLALPGLLVFAALTWRRLDIALCLLPLTFPYWYVPKRVFGHAVFPLSEIALLVCVAVALARLIAALRDAGGFARVRARLQDMSGRVGRWTALGAGLFLVGTTIGVLVARRPHEALRAYRWEVVEPLVYLALVLLFVRGRRAAHLLVWSLLGSAAIIALLAVLQVTWLHVAVAPLAEGNRILPFVTSTGGLPRATALIYGSPNSLGAWVERALPLALALALARRPVRLRQRAFAAAVVLLCVPALLWSDSRGAWVGVAVGCVVVLFAWLRRVWVPLAAVIVGIFVALWQRAALANILLEGHHGTGAVRVLLWRSALHMIRDHPLFGIGPDQFLYYYSGLYTKTPYWITTVNGHPTTAALDPTLSHPHNLFLELWLSGGVLAFAGLLLVLGALWLRCLRLWHAQAYEHGDAWIGAVALGIGAAVLAGVVHGLVDNAYFVPDLALAFWWAVVVLPVLEGLATGAPQQNGAQA